MTWLPDSAGVNVHVVHEGRHVFVDLHVELEHQRVGPEELRLLRNLNEGLID